MRIQDQDVYLYYGEASENLTELDRATQEKGICTVLGPSGAGKSALMRHWRERGSRQYRPEHILIVSLVPTKDSYRSATHMLYIQMLDSLQQHMPPAYVSRRLFRHEADRQNKKSTEGLRKDVVGRLAICPIAAVVFDNSEFLDQPAFYATLGFLERHALIFSGQPRRISDGKQLTDWIMLITNAIQAWRHAIELQLPTWQELRGTKEQRGLIRELLEDHVRTIVPLDEHREEVNRRFGNLLKGTQRHWGSIARLIALIEDYAEAQPGSAVRHITHRAIDQIISRLRLIDPASLQAVIDGDLKDVSRQEVPSGVSKSCQKERTTCNVLGWLCKQQSSPSQEVHMDATTDTTASQSLLTQACEQLTTLTQTLVTALQEQPVTLADLEQQVVSLLKQLGSSLLAGLAHIAAPQQPASHIPCPCGQQARYQRQRTAQITTLLGPIQIARAYYLCSACGHGQHPLDTQLHFYAGSRSAALDELLALLGATQDSFAQAATVLERLTLVHISPNSVRDATETLGALLVQHQALPLEQHSQQPHTTPTATLERLYIGMDGVFAHLHERGWSEVKVGCCYQAHSLLKHRPEKPVEIRAHSISYVTALEEANRFGWQLWQEAVRRGLLTAKEVVVIGDGAHWIWTIAETHFPQATQIVDWYHASGYLWEAARTIWGERSLERERWARAQVALLWEGEVEAVLAELEQWRTSGEAVEGAVSYYTTHRGRMAYGTYRARGLQIGSGSVESACKQLVSARLKQAGMIWNAVGAESVASVRAWLKSGRWEEALAMRTARTRRYERKQPQGESERGCLGQHAVEEQKSEPVRKVRQEISAEALAQVQAELTEQRGKNVWRRARKPEHHRQQAAIEQPQVPAIAA